MMKWSNNRVLIWGMKIKLKTNKKRKKSGGKQGVVTSLGYWWDITKAMVGRHPQVINGREMS